jgi:tRNA threonylcarbamoyladenosine biosynthesis protein TsaB
LVKAKGNSRFAPNDDAAMLILAFDTSGFSGSVALLDGSQVLATTPLAADRRSAQTLVPAIVRLLADCSLTPSDVKLVATTIGPGSFTGLRVGATTAKTFAYAVGAEVIGVSTLDAIAHGIPAQSLQPPREIHAVVDAQRRELFLGRFRGLPQSNETAGLPALTRLEPDRIVPADEWLSCLPAETIVTGSGLAKLTDRLPSGVFIAPPELQEAQAVIIGQLAWRDYQSGRRDDLWTLAPVYLRPSYAEEKARKTQ